MPKFRNGNRVVDAWQEASGDWLIIDMKEVRAWPESDVQFRGRWEPADTEARRMWSPDREPVGLSKN